MNDAMSHLVEVMLGTFGKDLSAYDETFLARSVDRRRTALGLDEAEDYAGYVAQDSLEALELVRSLGITYSEFFRDPLAFALLEQVVLPALMASGRPEIRVWSAGCAAGQEAYSVAILLDEICAKQDAPVGFRVFATDVSEADLALAAAAVYEAAAVRNVRLRHLLDCFEQEGEAYRVVPRIRDRVDISVHCLLDDRSGCPQASIYGDFDLVLCGNVLFYYRPDIQQAILGRLCACLRPKGYLVTGDAERAIVDAAGGFQAVAQLGAVFMRRGGI